MLIEYKIDVKKPPVGPPNITRKKGFLFSYETNESKQNRENYSKYIKEYRKALYKSISPVEE